MANWHFGFVIYGSGLSHFWFMVHLSSLLSSPSGVLTAQLVLISCEDLLVVTDNFFLVGVAFNIDGPDEGFTFKAHNWAGLKKY